MNEVYSFLQENINLSESQYLVIGVSGGADSMALLHILMKYCENSLCQIVCVHIHHNLRKESDFEQDFVKKYCEKNHLLFETTRLVYEDKFTESIGREKRYQFFEKILEKYQSQYLFTAHHGDDLMETMMMRLVRGSSLKGICGIVKTSKREKYTILRPLLYLTKEEIYQYVLKNAIPYVEDNSNQDSHYTRNRYRKAILPFLKEENENVHLKFLECSEELQETLEYIENIVQKRYEKIVVNERLRWNLFVQEEVLVQKEILKKFLFQIYQEDIIKITKNHVRILMNFIKEGTVNSFLDFPNHYQVIKTYDEILFTKESKSTNYCYPLEGKVDLPNNHYVEVLTESDETTNFVTYLDSSMLSLPLYVRNCCPGDKMSVKNMQGHKKIGDIFTNEKIPASERKMWPVVVDNNGQIIWLPGLKKTQFDRKKTGIYDIILKYY